VRQISVNLHARSPYFSATDKQPTPDIGAIVGDLVVSGATFLAHSAAEAVVKRVKKAAADTARWQAVAKIVKKAKKSVTRVKAAVTRKTKARKASSKSGSKKARKSVTNDKKHHTGLTRAMQRIAGASVPGLTSHGLRHLAAGASYRCAGRTQSR
jgi:hypothetical protein